MADVKLINSIHPTTLRNPEVNGDDLIHGAMKIAMYQVQEELEGETDVIKRAHLEGKELAYAEVYQLTYDIAFARVGVDR